MALWEVVAEIGKLKRTNSELEVVIGKVQQEHLELTAQLSPSSLSQLVREVWGTTTDHAAKLPKHVVNVESGTIHICDWVRSSWLVQGTWVTRCSWQFGISAGTFAYSDDQGFDSTAKCKRCFQLSLKRKSAESATVPQSPSGSTSSSSGGITSE